jgi:hypothetical protein
LLAPGMAYYYYSLPVARSKASDIKTASRSMSIYGLAFLALVSTTSKPFQC